MSDLFVLQSRFAVEQGRPPGISCTQKVAGMTVAQVENLSWFLASDCFHLAEYFGIGFFAAHFAGDEEVMKNLVNLQISKHGAEAGVVVGKNRQFIATISERF